MSRAIVLIWGFHSFMHTLQAAIMKNTPTMKIVGTKFVQW